MEHRNDSVLGGLSSSLQETLQQQMQVDLTSFLTTLLSRNSNRQMKQSVFSVHSNFERELNWGLSLV
jgi:hypothetical protein